MNTLLLEERLAANPKSPLFARLADRYLKDGKIDRAIEICVNGLKQHPDYPTAHLVLGRCYESAGRNVEAIIEYRRVLKAVPENSMVQTLVGDIEKREHEAFQKFSEERIQQLKGKRGTLSFEGFVSGTGSDAKQPETREEEEESSVETGIQIATVTLAEIYASQGQYGEAAQVYQRLLAERPENEEEYRKRVEELRILEKTQQQEMRP